MFNIQSTVPEWLSDVDTTLIVQVNDAACAFWRYKREQMIGMRATSLLAEEEVPRSETLRLANMWGETGPWRCIRGDGSECWMSVRWQEIVYNGKRCHFVFPVSVGETRDTMRRILPELVRRRTASPSESAEGRT